MLGDKVNEALEQMLALIMDADVSPEDRDYLRKLHWDAMSDFANIDDILESLEAPEWKLN